MHKTINKKISILTYEHPYEGIALRILLLGVLILSCSYLYFVTSSVFHVMARREADTRVLAASASIAQSEHSYFILSQSMTPDTAPVVGLSLIKQTSYVYRTGLVGATVHGVLARNEI